MFLLHYILSIIVKPVHKIEYDSVTQFKFHFFWTWFWFLAMPIMFIIIPKHNSTEWTAFGIFEVSLWANFVSHFTAIGSAIAGIFAANREDEIPGLKIYKRRLREEIKLP